MKAYVFPGQGSQHVGMGQALYNASGEAKSLFEKANSVLGFSITDIMFYGTEAELKSTKVTQPAIFLHSVILAKTLPDFKPDMVAGHSLGEVSALAAAGALSFEAALNLVAKRAEVMQQACESNPSAMAAIIGLADDVVEAVCENILGVVVTANYNSPGQIVISGETDAVNMACEQLKEKGAKRALLLPVGGAFHSPLMEPARKALEATIMACEFMTPVCPIYQNKTSMATTNPSLLQQNLVHQMTAPVKFTSIVNNMVADGATSFTEVGPGAVLQGLIKRINDQVAVDGVVSLS